MTGGDAPVKITDSQLTRDRDNNLRQDPEMMMAQNETVLLNPTSNDEMDADIWRE